MTRSRPYRVDPAIRRAVLERDGACILAKIEPDHVCRDLWGHPHASDDLDRLSLEHVKDQLTMGKRAPSDEAHMVALCGYANVAVPSKRQREYFRDYLRMVTA